MNLTSDCHNFLRTCPLSFNGNGQERFAEFMSNKVRVSPRGTITLPASVRRKLKLDRTHDLVVMEERSDGVLLRPAVPVSVRDISPKRMKQWIAADEADAATAKILKR